MQLLYEKHSSILVLFWITNFTARQMTRKPLFHTIISLFHTNISFFHTNSLQWTYHTDGVTSRGVYSWHLGITLRLVAWHLPRRVCLVVRQLKQTNVACFRECYNHDISFRECRISRMICRYCVQTGSAMSDTCSCLPKCIFHACHEHSNVKSDLIPHFNASIVLSSTMWTHAVYKSHNLRS